MPAEIDVDVNMSCRFEIECPECGAPVEFDAGDERVECIDYDDLPYGCGTEFLLGDPSVVVHWAPSEPGDDIEEYMERRARDAAARRTTDSEDR